MSKCQQNKNNNSKSKHKHHMAEEMLHILHLYLLLALLMSTHMVGGVESTIYSLPKDKLTVKLSRQRIVKVTKNLVNYYLYFGESETSQFGFDNETCLRARNDTHAALASAVVTCVNPNFTPRILTKNQVTWKPKGKPLSPPKDIMGDNGTTSNQPDANEEENNDRNSKIHNHLIFTLLLPHHPFSQQVRRVMTTASPMFPNVAFVFGSAYEFQELAAKYFATSFPKIMYFKGGTFVENYSGAYEVEEVAAQIAEWANSLPGAVPIPFKYTKLAAITENSPRQFDIYTPKMQMKHGLSLQPLPLLAHYPLIDVQVPAWIVAFIPQLAFLNNSAYIDKSAQAAVVEVNTIPMTSITSEDATATAATVAAASSNDTVTEKMRMTPLVITIPVPFPNAEPFIGSLNNYAVWNTRIFLLAAAYTIARFSFLI